MNSPPIFEPFSGWIESDVHWGITGILASDPWPYARWGYLGLFFVGVPMSSVQCSWERIAKRLPC